MDQEDQGDHNPPWWTRTGFYILLMCGGVRVGSYEGDSVSVVDLCDKALREETVEVSEGGGSYVKEGGSSAVCNGVGSRVGSAGDAKS